MTEAERQLALALQEGPTMRAAPVSAGNRVEDFLRRFLPRVTAERLAAPVDPILQYGPIPAQAAVEMAKQPARAGEAVGEAITDPTLANVTNAGVQTGTALMPVARGAGAALTAGSAALGYGEAARRDFAQPAAANAQGAERDLGAMVKGDPQLEAMHAEMKRLDGAGKADVQGRSKVESDRIRQEARDQAAVVRKDILKILSDKAATEEGKKLADYNAAVARAEQVRADELRRDKKFYDSNLGHVWEKTGAATPLAAAAGLTGVAQLAKRAVGSSLTPKEATTLGLGAAIPASNYPLLADGYLDTPADNPVKRAEEAYAYELPAGHPKKAEAEARAAKMDRDNPIRKAAQEDFLNPIGMAGRTVIGIAEGYGGGHLGKFGADLLAKGPGYAAEGLAAMPGRMWRSASDAFAKGRAPAGPGAGGGGPSTGSQPPQGPSPPNGGPAQPYVEYDQTSHGPVAQQVLRDLLAGAQNSKSSPLSQPGFVDNLANRVRGNLTSRGVDVDPAVVNSRAAGTAGELADREALLRATGSGYTLTSPKIREQVISQATGKDHTLAVPATAGAGLAAYGMTGGEAQAAPETQAQRMEAARSIAAELLRRGEFPKETVTSVVRNLVRTPDVRLTDIARQLVEGNQETQ